MKPRAKSKKNRILARIEWGLIVSLSQTLAILPQGFTAFAAALLKPLLFQILQFRKTVITQNLRRSFPDRTDADIRTIADGYADYFCNLLLEIVRTLSLPKKILLETISFENAELLQSYQNQGRGVAIVMGHISNWERGIAHAATLFSKQKLYCVYHPVKSFGFNRLVYKVRTVFGLRMIPMAKASQKFKQLTQQKEFSGAPFSVIFIGDQSAPAENAHWTQFLNQETAFFWGMERLSRKLDLAVVYMEVVPLSHCQYRIRFETLLDDVTSLPPGTVIERFKERLERQIHENPTQWLWSHRRWKAQKPKTEEPQNGHSSTVSSVVPRG